MLMDNVSFQLHTATCINRSRALEELEAIFIICDRIVTKIFAIQNFHSALSFKKHTGNIGLTQVILSIFSEKKDTYIIN